MISILPNFFSRLEDWFIYLGMPVVTCYHLLCSNVFLNTAAEDAKGLEKIGNVLLSPFQYLFAGYEVYVLTEETYALRQHFNYKDSFFIRTAGAVLSLPLTMICGSVVKGIAFLSPEVRCRHNSIVSSLRRPFVVDNRDYYQKLLIDINELSPSDKLISLGYEREPGADQYFSEEKKALKEIICILKEHRIPFWIDCGTCLGSYRYGGIIPWDNDLDIAILEPDFANVKRALSLLDQKKYLVEDWSNRSLPETYIRIYVRSTRQFIDIYTFAIYPDITAIQYICSNKDSCFMTENWKINERYYEIQTPYEVVFPLARADFDGIEVLVPHQTKRYLQMRYGENLAPVRIYNPKTKTYEKDLSHPYWDRSFVH